MRPSAKRLPIWSHAGFPTTARFARLLAVYEDVHTLDDAFEPVLIEARRQVQSGLRPSIQVAANWRGRICVDFAVGLEPTSVTAHYLLWSSIKPFVALGLLQLIEAGAASLEDRIAKFIPEFGCHGKESATLAHLLTHRGGFPDSAPEVARELSRLQGNFREALAYVCDMPARWEPGKDRGYHPRSGWIVLGEVIQRLSGRPLYEVIRQQVVQPAGIDADAFALGDPERLSSHPMHVQTLPRRGAPSQAEANLWNADSTLSALNPGAVGISRANQVVRFYRCLLDTLEDRRSRLLGYEMVRCATFPHVVGIQDRTFLLDIPWGLGMHLKHVRPSLDDCGRSATPGTFGHGGHFLVNTAWGDPGKNLAFCALSNGLAPSRDGRVAVERLSQSVHEVVDQLTRRD